jgi:hypothetical protein
MNLDIKFCCLPYNTREAFLMLKMGPIFLRCTKILSQCHLFLSFLPSYFLPCKNTFMDDYDGIENCNGLKYSPFEVFDNF